MKIYVASSWRNQWQQGVVRVLRHAGFDVYDFRNPAPGEHGFAWSDIDPNWQSWTTDQYAEALKHPIAVAGFQRDLDALKSCQAVVLVLPCGRSAHVEAGAIHYATYVYSPEPFEPELMYSMFRMVSGDLDSIIGALKEQEKTGVHF